MRNFLLFMLFLLLTGCSILPGMENLDTSSIPIEKSKYAIRVQPIIIPITPFYLLQHPAPSSYVYHVASPDVLNIMVWNHPEFNIPAQQTNVSTTPAATTTTQTPGVAGFIVDPQGKIYLPLVGNVRVAGKSISAVRSILLRRLSDYVRNPQVYVRVMDYRSKKVFVMGEVLKPGIIYLTDQPLSITEALNQMGSFDPNSADPRHVYVIRGSIIHPRIYWLNVSSPTALLLGNQFQLQANDVLIVSAAVVTRWNRFLNQLLPTLQTVWYTKAITTNNS